MKCHPYDHSEDGTISPSLGATEKFTFTTYPYQSELMNIFQVF